MKPPVTQGGDAAPESGSVPHYSRRQAIVASAALLAAVTFVEGNSQASCVDVTRHSVPLPKLRAPCRIVQLTDIHRSQFVLEPFVSHIVDQANALKPDVMLLTGDFVTRTSDYAESCMRHLERLHAPLGKYAVLGNHDYWCDDGMGGPIITDWLERTGIEVVTNRSTRLGNGLRLVGVDDLLAGVVNYRLSFEAVRDNEPVVVMSHNPGTFYTLCRFNCLTISGHTHGGQVYVPGISKWFVGSRFLRGWCRVPNRPGSMYVSRGLGTIHVPMRICSAPEISVFDLTPA